MRLTEKQFAELMQNRNEPIIVEPKSKYKSHKTVVDGIKFDSIAEAKFYEQLKLEAELDGVIFF